MTVSMRVMSAGDGYKYLLRTVAAGDGDRSLSTPLTRYYNAEGTPPGRWMGSGLPALGRGQIASGDEVSEAQLQLLVGMGRDPVTGLPLGRAYPVYKSVAQRIEERTATLDPHLDPVERARAITAIEAEESERGTRRAVAGFDFTFSIPKSASVLWAVADAGTQSLIAQAHHDAVADMVAYMEREVAATRTGASAGDGAVAQVDVTGIIATAYDHYDSRAGDPHLHTHVVISNKVQTVLDSRWRSLDSRPMHGATVALSELHEALFADHLTRMLGVSWESRERGRDRNRAWAITGVPEALVAEFSTRARHIDEATDRLIQAYVIEHGRRPSAAVIMKLRAQATLSTRPEKTVHSLAELTATWRNRATVVLGEDATGWARRIAVNGQPLLLRADDIPLDIVRRLGESVVAAVGEKRSTWRRWNLTAEAARQTMDYRFASTQDREAVVGLVVDAAVTEFAAHGPDGTTIERIAKASGVNKERVYNYFGDKRELFARVLREELAKVAQAVPVESFAIEDVGDYAGRVYDYHRERPELTRLLRWEGLTFDAEVPDEAQRREYYGYKTAAVTAGQQAGTVTQEIEADQLMFLILALAGWWSAVPQVARMISGPENEAEHARRRASVVTAARSLAHTRTD